MGDTLLLSAYGPCGEVLFIIALYYITCSCFAWDTWLWVARGTMRLPVGVDGVTLTMND